MEKNQIPIVKPRSNLEAEFDRLLSSTELFATIMSTRRLYLQQALEEEIITEEEYIRRIEKLIFEVRSILFIPKQSEGVIILNQKNLRTL